MRTRRVLYSGFATRQRGQGVDRLPKKLPALLLFGQLSWVAILVAALLFAGIETRADTITLAVAGSKFNGGSTNYNVASNAVAQIVSAYSPTFAGFGSSLSIELATQPGLLASWPLSTTGTIVNPPIVVGPATITLAATNGYSTTPSLAFCTIQITSSTSFSPSTAVVIPNDGGGPVTIILESSLDLINWTPALPGAYGTTSSNRFFRVRAQR